MNEWIVNQDRFEQIGRIEDPVGIRRQAKNFAVRVETEFIPEFHRVTGLGEPLGAGSANLQGAARGKSRRIRQCRPTRHRLINRDVSERLAARTRRTFSQGVEDDDWQVRDEVDDIVTQQQITLAARWPRQQSVREGAGAHLHTVVDSNGSEVNR